MSWAKAVESVSNTVGGALSGLGSKPNRKTVTLARNDRTNMLYENLLGTQIKTAEQKSIESKTLLEKIKGNKQIILLAILLPVGLVSVFLIVKMLLEKRSKK